MIPLTGTNTTLTTIPIRTTKETIGNLIVQYIKPKTMILGKQ